MKTTTKKLSRKEEKLKLKKENQKKIDKLFPPLDKTYKFFNKYL